jgi:conjugal transfer/entry exclusion protein
MTLKTQNRITEQVQEHIERYQKLELQNQHLQNQVSALKQYLQSSQEKLDTETEVHRIEKTVFERYSNQILQIEQDLLELRKMRRGELDQCKL